MRWGGNIVHNLRAARHGTAADEAFDWAREFDTFVHAQIKNGTGFQAASTSMQSVLWG